MNRTIAVLAVLLSFFVFANTSGAGSSDPAAGRMVRISGAVVLSEGQQDRCQIAASCSASCILCAVTFLNHTASFAEINAVGADLHRALAAQTLSKKLYRPPKSEGLTINLL